MSEQRRYCAHCGQTVRVAMRFHLFAPHDDQAGRPCPGGVHGETHWPVEGDPRRAPWVRENELVERVLVEWNCIPLDEALDRLGLPDHEVEQLIQDGQLRVGWARWGYETHVVVDVDDVAALETGPRKVSLEKPL